ncbi:hypothetical protein [Streptomyces sp. F001]|uniref:hypothetical protein n=1 Tax=Streptomyces sp. F001 TaxID=1510026 RepID=UPI0013EE7DB7|nr:hypothetical protein [Streptomyces sp. F001]
MAGIGELGNGLGTAVRGPRVGPWGYDGVRAVAREARGVGRRDHAQPSVITRPGQEAHRGSRVEGRRGLVLARQASVAGIEEAVVAVRAVGTDPAHPCHLRSSRAVGHGLRPCAARTSATS